MSYLGFRRGAAEAPHQLCWNPQSLIFSCLKVGAGEPPLHAGTDGVCVVLVAACPAQGVSCADSLCWITRRSIVKFVGLGFRTDRSGSNTDAVSADSMFIIQV